MNAIERVARAICRTGFDGYDPDEVIRHKPPPDGAELPSNPDADEHCYYDEQSQEWDWAWRRWRSYAKQAVAAIEAYEAE